LDYWEWFKELFPGTIQVGLLKNLATLRKGGLKGRKEGAPSPIRVFTEVN